MVDVGLIRVVVRRGAPSNLRMDIRRPVVAGAKRPQLSVIILFRIRIYCIMAKFTVDRMEAAYNANRLAAISIFTQYCLAEQLQYPVQH